MTAAYDTSTALVVVDVQNDFADPEGNLYVPGGEEAVGYINEQVAFAGEAGTRIVYTQDWHPETTPHFEKDGGIWPVHCVADTRGADFHPDLDVVEGAEFVKKGSGGEDGYSAFNIRDPVTDEVSSTGLADRLRELDVETHLLLSPWGARTLEHETAMSADALRDLADVVHKTGDQAAAVSSGSFLTDGMIVAPCSMRTLAGIATGYADDLITRAADVVLKEGRRLVLLVRESPLSAIHLENMLKGSRRGAVIWSPMPAVYTLPKAGDGVGTGAATGAAGHLGVAGFGGELVRGHRLHHRLEPALHLLGHDPETTVPGWSMAIGARQH